MKIIYSKLILFCLLLALNLTLSGQVEKEFWFAAPNAAIGDTLRRFDLPIVLRLVAFNEDANVVITQPANPNFSPISVLVSAHTAQTIDLSSQIDKIENKPANALLNYGLHIVSNSYITTYYEVTSTNCGCGPATYVMKGKVALGTNFLIPTQNFLRNEASILGQASNSFIVLATMDSTSVQITPSKDILGHSAGVTFSVWLQKGQTYVSQASSNLPSGHLAGSKVVSNRPITITESDDVIAGYEYGGCSDLAGDQIVPIQAFGTDFVAMGGVLFNPKDKAFILASEDSTIIYQDGINKGLIHKGQTLQLSIPDSSTFIKATKPVNVTQLSGLGCEFGTSILPPIVCTGSYEVGFVRSTNEKLYINLLAKSGTQGNFKINGLLNLIKSVDFKPVPATSGEWVTARYLLNLDTFPKNGGVFVTNDSAVFHLGVLEGDVGSGARFGYFSNYGKFQVKAKLSVPNPCIKTSVLLKPDTMLRNAIYHWIGPSLNSSSPINTLSNLDTSMRGWYLLEVQLFGCEAIKDSVFLPIHLPNYQHVSSLVNDSIICAKSKVLFWTDSVPFASYHWTGPNNFFSNNRSFHLDNILFKDTGFYKVSVSSLGCLPEVDSIFLKVYSDYTTVTASAGNAPACFNKNILLTADSISGANYSWIGPNGFTSSLRQATVNNFVKSKSGYYKVSMYTEGCLAVEDSILINLRDTHLVKLNVQRCLGDTFVFPNGTRAYFNTIDTSVFKSLSGCDSTIITSLTFKNSISFNIFDSLCENSSYTLPNGVEVFVPGVYSFKYKSANGCDSLVNYRLSYYSRPTLSNLKVKNVSCYGWKDGLLDLSNVVGTNPIYFWVNNQDVSKIVSNLSAKDYLIEVLDGNYCWYEQQVKITSPAPIDVNINPVDPVILAGSKVELLAKSNFPDVNFLWLPSNYLNCDTCNNVFAKPPVSIRYSVKAYKMLDDKMCYGEASTYVDIRTGPKFYIPTAISANNDNLNDGFNLTGENLDLLAKFKIQIANRWGEIIFESESPDFKWDATFDGNPVQADVYTYFIEYSSVIGNKQLYQISGNFSVLR